MDMSEDPTKKSYRELAAKCREMATHTAKPASLVMLAEHYEAIAEDIKPSRA
jgi:hypothetical protein